MAEVRRVESSSENAYILRFFIHVSARFP
jgi:hypothetical protein